MDTSEIVKSVNLSKAIKWGNYKRCPNWSQFPREARERDSDIVEVDLDEYNDAELLLLIAVNTVAQSVGFAEQLQDFDQCYEFSRLNKVDNSLRAQKSQKSPTDYFSSWNPAKASIGRLFRKES